MSREFKTYIVILKLPTGKMKSVEVLATTADRAKQIAWSRDTRNYAGTLEVHDVWEKE